MLTTLRSALAAVTIAAGSLLVQTSDASAAIIYNWSGNCTSNCTDGAAAELQVADSYVAGAELTAADFVSFFYTSSTGSFRILDNSFIRAISGRLPAIGTSDAAVININFTGGGANTRYFTRDNRNDTWRARYSPAGIGNPNGSGGDRGRNSAWSSVDLPAPGSLLALLGALLAGGVVYGYSARRREDEGSLATA